MIAIGLMSGTSIDGIDAALVRLLPRGNSYEADLLAFQTFAFAEEDLQALRAILPPNPGSTAGVARVHHRLGLAFAQAAKQIAGDASVDYIASHGQTVYHDGDAHITFQIGDPFVIRERMQRSVIYDFRSADCAAGGHGAPLVPYLDALLLVSDSENRVAVNIGGIANLTIIPRRSAPDSVLAFDSGPGNMLIDAFVRERTNGAVTFDKGGELGLRGRADNAVLAEMLKDSFVLQPPPKTTGRERFGAQFLSERAVHLQTLSLEDGAATLAAFTAAALAEAIKANAPARARVIVSGGGAHNRAILRELEQRLPGFRVERSDAVKVPVDAKEAIAFAMLGYETLRDRAANVPRATGAAHRVVLGAIAPHELPELLQKVENECRI